MALQIADAWIKAKKKQLLTEMLFRAVAKSYSQFVICETYYRSCYLTSVKEIR